MSWVWERFRNTFRSSADDDVEADTERVRFLLKTIFTVVQDSYWLLDISIALEISCQDTRRFITIKETQWP
jgi:hypothetical protein